MNRALGLLDFFLNAAGDTSHLEGATGLQGLHLEENIVAAVSRQDRRVQEWRCDVQRFA